GWEAAVFDHYKAVVATVLARLGKQTASSAEDTVGGSTFTIDVWPGHPLMGEVVGTLKQVRSTLGDLRRRVIEYNQGHPRPSDYSRVVIYAGQNLISESVDEAQPLRPATDDEP